jgi:hypothetical protein
MTVAATAVAVAVMATATETVTAAPAAGVVVGVLPLLPFLTKLAAMAIRVVVTAIASLV